MAEKKENTVEKVGRWIFGIYKRNKLLTIILFILLVVLLLFVLYTSIALSIIIPIIAAFYIGYKQKSKYEIFSIKFEEVMKSDTKYITIYSKILYKIIDDDNKKINKNVIKPLYDIYVSKTKKKIPYEYINNYIISNKKNIINGYIDHMANSLVIPALKKNKKSKKHLIDYINENIKHMNKIIMIKKGVPDPSSRMNAETFINKDKFKLLMPLYRIRIANKLLNNEKYVDLIYKRLSIIIE